MSRAKLVAAIVVAGAWLCPLDGFVTIERTELGRLTIVGYLGES